MNVSFSDKQLLEKFHADKHAGFRLIVKKYQQRVYWQIRRISKNHQDSEDIMQNVFVKAWHGLENFREESGLYTWLFRIAFNETQTFLSRENKKKTVDVDPPLFENSISVEGRDYSGAEIESLLYKALDTLPEKQRLVFELKYFDDLKFTEVAEITGTSVGALKASYHLASKKIEEFIKST